MNYQHRPKVGGFYSDLEQSEIFMFTGREQGAELVAFVRNWEEEYARLTELKTSREEELAKLRLILDAAIESENSQKALKIKQSYTELYTDLNGIHDALVNANSAISKHKKRLAIWEQINGTA